MSRLAAAFDSAARWLLTHKKSVLGVFVFALIGVFGTAHAAHADTFETVGSWLSGMSIISLLAQLLNWIASGVGLLIVTLINVILVPILNYNGFATSPIVDLGWSLVRDTVNMFVVVILLVIAILTIVGSPKANWQQQIPRLFIFTIAVNFSRTICGVLIDLSNVIMFQFVNAILEVGAGNFAQLLQLNTFGDYSTLADMAIMPWQNLAAAYLQLTMMLAVLAVILIMTIVYIYRIVVLWILIIMSPAAFFSGGIKEVFGPAGGMYGDWWKKFSSALILGPMLTFFLWLSLAAAASGDVVTSENFPTGESDTSFGIVLKVFEMSNITSLLIGLVLLVVGMQQASGFAGALGSFAGGLINEGMGQNVVKRAARLPFLGGREVARQADRRIGGALDASLGVHRGSLMSHLGAGVMGAGENLRGRGGIASLAGRAFSSAGDRMTRTGEAGLHEATHNAQERVKNWSQDRLQSELRIAAQQVANGQQPPLFYNRDSGEQAFAALMTKRSQQRGLEGQANTPDEREALDNIFAAGLTRVRENRDHLLEKQEEKDAFQASETRYLDLHRNEDGTLSGRAREVVRDDAFKRGLVRPRALRADDEQSYNRAQQIRQMLMDKTARVTEDGTRISEWDEMRNGNGVNSDLRDAANALENRVNGVRTVYNEGATPQGAQNAAEVNAPGVTAAEIEASIRGGTLNVNNLTADNFDSPNGEAIVQAMVNVGRGPQDLPDDASRNWFQATATDMANAGRLTGPGRGAVDNYNLDEQNVNRGYSAPGNTTPQEVFRDRSPGAPAGNYDLDRIAEAVENSARATRHLADALNHPTQGRQVADAVTASISPEAIRRLAQEWRTNPAPDNRDQIRRAIQEMTRAMQTHMAANMPPRGMSWQDHNARTAESYDNLRAASSRMGLGDPGVPPTRP